MPIDQILSEQLLRDPDDDEPPQAGCALQCGRSRTVRQTPEDDDLPLPPWRVRR
jgi:hypothetical protein